MEEYFKEKGISWDQKLSDLSDEQREELIQKTNQIMSLNLKFRPEFIIDEKEKTYTFVTGMNGNVSGKIPSGRYLIEPEKLKKVDILINKYINIKNTGKRRLFIGLRKGRGKIIYPEPQRIPASNTPKALDIKIAKLSDLGPLTNEDLIIQLFNSDKKQEPILWAGVKIKLTLISNEKELSFIQGINELEIKENLISFNTAFELLLDLEKKGSSPDWVKIKDGKPEDVFSFQGESFFGTDFSLEKDKTYQFWINKPVKLVISDW